MNVSLPTRKIRKGRTPWDIDLGHLLTRTTQYQKPSDPQVCLVSQASLTDETCSTGDSLPSFSLTTSEPASSALSRPSSLTSHIQPDRNSIAVMHHDTAPTTPHLVNHITEDDDPLSYHSDFDYYTQSRSDSSDSEPDVHLATPEKPGCHSPPIHVGITPYPSVYDPVDLEPRTAIDTTRRDSMFRQGAHLIRSPNLDSPQDGGAWRRQPTEPERQSGWADESKRETTGRNGDPSGGHSSGGDGHSGTGGDDHNDKARQRKSRSSVSSTSDFTSSSDDDADSITVYYSLDGASNDSPPRAHSRTRSRYSRADGSDDDVPLAQRVPTALSAQKSIRRQLHDERRQRKLERAKGVRTTADSHLPARPSESFRTPIAPSSRKRSVSAAPAPGSDSLVAPTDPFPIEDLTRKLANLHHSTRTPAAAAPPTYDSPAPTNVTPRAPGFASGVSRSPSRGRYVDQTAHLQRKTSSRAPEAPSQNRSLRPMRSFHRPNGRHSETQSSSLEHTSNTRLERSTTSTAPNRATRTGHEQYTKSARTSLEGRRPSANAPRSSTERESDVAQRTVQRPPVPPLPISDSTPPQHMLRGPVVQQRIFIGDMQRFNMVEITPATNAGDVIDTVASQGMLDRSGSWMLFEVAQDYGMERPVREYELLADVTASWNKDKMLNAFVIKQTPLAQPLSRSSIPTSSPMHRGWVEWESKRGKWSKRWMELREHGLWLSKRATGKDETFLCSLSNFDAYLVTRRHKSPKPFVFAVKSTDHPSLFENAADYVHVFCCNPTDGESWIQAILIARSYVLYQERNVLFAKPGEILPQAKPLARSRTRKQSVSVRPAQPLVHVPPPYSQSTTANVAFEPGSLLAKRKGDAPP